jgi:N6-adenosine-specific RNA methylase IME4
MSALMDLFNTEKELDEQKEKALKAEEEARKDKRKKILENRVLKEDELKKELPPLPDKKYQLILIDPPWRYEFSVSTSREIENQYPTMSLEEIKDLPIGEMAAKDSVIFLWVTSPKLEEGLEVLKAYGFKYVTSAVWDKVKIGMGYYFRSRHEFLLIGKKGSLPVPKPKNRKASVVKVRRGKHSAKPVEFYKIIEDMYPDVSKIEIFSRTKREGWDSWGYEEGKFPVPEYANKLFKEEWEQ